MSAQQSDRSIEVDPDWFNDEEKRLLNEDSMTWDNSTLQWAMVFSYIEGRHLLRRAKYGGGWRAAPLPERTDTAVYGFNFVGFYSENIRAKWSNSNTDIDWRPTRDTDDSQGASRGAQNVHNFYKRKLYTNDFKQQESLLAQCGKYARYIYVSDEVKIRGRREQTERQQVQFGGSYFCADCGMAGSLPPGTGDGNTAAMQPDPGIDAGMVSQDAAGAGQAFSGAELPSEELAEQQINRQDPAAYQQGEAIEHGQPGAMVQPGAVPAGMPGMEPPQGLGMGGLGADENMVGSRMDSGFGQLSPNCPDCGSPNISVEPAEPFEVERVTGYEDIDQSDICCETVPAFELKHDLQKDPHKSPYLIRRRRIRTAILQSKFSFIQVKTAKRDDWGLRMEESLKRSTFTQGSGFWIKDANDEPSTDFIQVWMDPCLYSRNKLKQPLTTLSGQTVPAGTMLIEMFPTGLYMAFIEGVDGVVELRNEHHKDFWVGSVLRPRAVSSLGCGIEDVVEGNRQLNLIYSIIYTQLRTAAMPATLFDERLLPNGVSTYLGSLSNIPVNLSAIEQSRLADAVFQLQPQPPTAQHFGYADKLNSYMQIASRVTDFSGGLPGVNNGTATGAQITSANSQSLFGPQLANKGEVDRVSAEIILRLFKKYFIDEVYVSLQGRRGKQDGIWLRGADINVDLFAEVVGESYLPQTNLERRERWDGFLQRVGGLPGLKQALSEFPDQVEQLAEIFDVDLAGEDYTTAAELCRERIEQFKAGAPMVQVMQQGMPPVQMQPDPMSGQMVAVPVDPMAEAGQFLLRILNPPPDIEQLGHLASIQYLRSWLGEDERKELPPEVAAGVKALIYFHVDGLMAEAQLTGMVAAAGMPPAPPMGAGQPNEKSKEGGGKQPTNPNPQASQMQPPRPKPQAQSAAGM